MDHMMWRAADEPRLYCMRRRVGSEGRGGILASAVDEKRRENVPSNISFHVLLCILGKLTWRVSLFGEGQRGLYVLISEIRHKPQL